MKLKKKEDKRVALSVYTNSSVIDKINRCYALAVLDGYNGSRQDYINKILDDALNAQRR